MKRANVFVKVSHPRDTMTDNGGVVWQCFQSPVRIRCDWHRSWHMKKTLMWVPRDADAPGINTEAFCDDHILDSDYFEGVKLPCES